MRLKFIVITIFIVSTTSVFAQQEWKHVLSINDLYEHYPEVIEKMFFNFNLDYPGLEKVKVEYEKNNVVAACQNLLEYYKNGNTASYLRIKQPITTNQRESLADSILQNIFIIQGVKGQVPVKENGHRNWNYRGSNNDVEWAWLSNRHPQIDSLFLAYKRTGNPDYAQYIDLFLRDFIIASMPYPAKASSTEIWRGLEVSFRAKVWPKIFYGLINSNYLSPATQLLILSSLPDHAHYNKNFHKKTGNWLSMEISGLATVAATFPEFKKSKEWLAYSITTMVNSMKAQVYPDGVQKELTSHYHNVTLESFEELKNICERSEMPLPEYYNTTLEQMYGYSAHTMRPDGSGPLNNDSDRNNIRGLILKGAKTFNRDDWKFIATNGFSGMKPKEQPSYFYPWAGHFVSRSGFESSAHWSFFDMGPWGIGHEHSDKLHLSISVYGRDLLVDAGRFAYSGKLYKKFRNYAIGSAGHNLLLIDDKGQKPGPASVKFPIDNNKVRIEEKFDYATSNFNSFNVEGAVDHNRTLLYVRGEFWIVVDRINTSKPRKISALWHWHPSCIISADAVITKTNNKQGNLLIKPITNQSFQLNLVKGQENPVQGWYSSEYNKVEASTTSIYSTYINQDDTIAWILVPGKQTIPNLKAKVLSKNKENIKIKVTSSNKTWILNIPFYDSSGVKVIVK